MHVNVRTAIVPIAGRNDRFLPATRSVAHALLPVLDVPLLQFAMDEAEAAKVERVVFVTAPSDTAVRHYVEGREAPGPRLVTFDTPGAAARIEAQRPRLEVAFATQAEPWGLGHAVLQAAAHALPGPVAVILPDDLFLGTPCLPELVERYQRSGAGHMVATVPVAPEAASSYGVLDPMDGARDRALRVVGIVEKPAPEDAPSSYAVAGRYILHPGIFGDLAGLRARPVGRLSLTHAIARGIDRVGLSGFLPSGQWFDCGTPEGMLDAAIALRRQRQSAALALAAE